MKQKQPSNLIFAYLILIILILSVICILASATLLIVKLTNRDEISTEALTQIPEESETDQPVSKPLHDPLLGETADAGMEYIDGMIFFGESTTTHLRARGVLSGGTDTHQVWADSSGTKTLSSKLLSEPLIYPPTGESLTLAEALAKEQPKYMVLSFGLNNIAHFVNNKSNYVNNYNKLISAITQASPETKIILQSVYPVSAACDDFSVDGTTVCSYTETLNEWICEIAGTHENVRFVDTASVLKAADGTLLSSYDAGDGVHLSADAYTQILLYLRTHAWKE
jgi:lysophospholipase L1-like esterase